MAKEVSKYIVPVGMLILGYYVLKSWGVISTPCDPSVCTPLCPRGPRYSRGYFEDCDPGYVSAGYWYNDQCVCLNAVGSSTVGSTVGSNKWIPLTEQEINKLKSMTMFSRR